MNNDSVKISEKVLDEFDVLVRESGVSPQELLSYIAKSYNIKDNFDNDFIDPDAYYDSFIA